MVYIEVPFKPIEQKKRMVKNKTICKIEKEKKRLFTSFWIGKSGAISNKTALLHLLSDAISLSWCAKVVSNKKDTSTIELRSIVYVNQAIL